MVQIHRLPGESRLKRVRREGVSALWLSISGAEFIRCRQFGVEGKVQVRYNFAGYPVAIGQSSS